MGYFDKGKNQFTKRTDKTIKPFIEINYEALAMVYDELVKVLNKKHIDDSTLEKLINNGSFPKIYAYCITKLDSINKDTTKSNEGIWRKYLQGSDPNILFNDIHGKGTGWCTAGGIETATTHLNGGDFYVYFTKDKNGEYTQPRIAIRTDNGSLAEIRGISDNQNLESEMEDVVEQKLQEFPDRDEYKKKVSDMRELTKIYKKHKNHEELTKQELLFLYETEDVIIGFGYEKDPRIKEIIDTRNIKKDLAFAFDCQEENISLTEREALRGNIKYHCGDLDLSSLTSAEGLMLPEVISGELDLCSLTSADGLVLPKVINGGLYLNSLTSAKGLKLPKVINGDLDLSNITSAEGLVLPEKLNGDLYLNSLTSAEGLVLPKILNSSIYLYGITSAKGLVLPEKLNGDLDLGGLRSAEGLVLPETLNGYLILSSLTSAEGLVLPNAINGTLDLNGLTSANGIVLPKVIGGSLWLNRLTSAEGLVLPTILDGDLDLSHLTSADGIVLPTTINGRLGLNSLTSVEGLVLPETIKGALELNRLTSINGLKLSMGITQLTLSNNVNIDLFFILGASVYHNSYNTTVELNNEIIEQFNAINRDKVDINPDTSKHK